MSMYMSLYIYIVFMNTHTHTDVKPEESTRGVQRAQYLRIEEYTINRSSSTSTVEGTMGQRALNAPQKCPFIVLI